MSELIKHTSDANFSQDVLKSEVPVLLDFWAEWCGPCKAMAPALDTLAQEYAGKLSIVKLDVDANQHIPRKFGIRGIPTLILFKDGQVKAQKVGAISLAQLKAFVHGHVA